MQKYQNNVTGRNGDVVIGGSVLVKVAGTPTPATIYSDNGVTLVTNPLTTDANGYFEFYVADGLYDISVNGTDAYTSVLIVDALTGLAGRPTTSDLAASTGAAQVGSLVEGTVQASLNARPTSAALAASGGAGLLGWIQDGVGAVLRFIASKLMDIPVTLADFGGVEDGVTDDSAAFQEAVDSLAATGGTILIKRTPLIGDVVVDYEGLTIKGRGNQSVIKVKNGTLGILVKQNFVNVENIRFLSQGTKTDGLNTRGLHYEKTPVNSIGLCSITDVDFRNFSGYGGKMINAINVKHRGGQIAACTDGFVYDRDAGAVYFGTTVSIDDLYLSGCTNGLNLNYLWRSRINVIAEDCDYGVLSNAGAFTLYRCYFEANHIKGVHSVNSEVQDLYSYSNNTTTDAVDITYTGAVAAADRGYARSNKFDVLGKRVGILSGYGVDPVYLKSTGTTANTGLAFAENIVPLIRGPNLMNNASWVSQRLAEFQGWDATQQGYKIAGTTAGDTTYGQKQTVTLVAAKQYIVDVASTTVTGSGILNIKCGSTVVTNGVPFNPPADGANVVTAYGIDTAGTVVECYIHAFTLAEVLVDPKQIALAQSKLTAKQQGRGIIHAAAAPVAGYWAVGEVVYNIAPTAGGTLGWVCTTAGTPGTWKTFGTIAA